MLKLKLAYPKAKSKVAPAKKRATSQTVLRDKGLLAASDEHILVTVAGIEAKVGATHLALSLALKASQRGINCAVIISSESFEALRHYYVLSVREELHEEQGIELRQFALFAGLNIMAGVLPSDLEGFQLIVWDCGQFEQGQRCFSRGDVCCLLSGGQPWELAPLSSLLMKLSYEELSRYLICIRGASESDFDHIKQQMAGKLPCVPLLHKPDWSDVVLREDLITILRHAGCS